MKTLTCIICPRGCSLTVKETDGKLEARGNACPRGEEYAIKECTNPVRTVTATVRVANRHNTMVAVKTETPVAKTRMMEVMAALRKVQVNAPLHIGDTVLEDAAGTRVVITKEIR